VTAPLAIRPAEPDDLPFIADSYAHSYRASHWAGTVPMHVWQRVARESFAWLLEEHEPMVLVAGEPKGPDLYGWIAVQRGLVAPQRVRDGGRWQTRTLPLGPIVHYVYVKEAYRRIGVARSLLRSAGVDPQSEVLMTHKTAAGVRALKDRSLSWRFNPLLARFPRKGAADATQHEEGQVA
jgi:GNAT superfamily N-acetyltransferase